MAAPSVALIQSLAASSSSSPFRKSRFSAGSSISGRFSSTILFPGSPRLSLRLTSRTVDARRRSGRGARAAYVSAPSADFESVSKRESSSDDFSPASPAALSWGVIWSLITRHKLRMAAACGSLIGGTACTLAMPIFSGKFFQILTGSISEPLWRLLSQISFLYALEPIFTIIYVTNMTIIWEEVMANLRGQIFRQILIQKVEFFDRHKVGELTGLLTSDLGSLKDLVNDNISRDRGLRALSEVVGTVCILFFLSTQLAPILVLLMVAISGSVAIFKRSTIPAFLSHSMAQANISDCATETFSAIRTVRSFAGEKRQISIFRNMVLAYQKSGIRLGLLKSANESLTRMVVYISLMALYILGGSKVKTGELSVGTMISFIGYTFTLTFAVQGGVNSLGDLRRTFAATERINSILSSAEIDVPLAYGLEKELQTNEADVDLSLDNGGLPTKKAQGISNHSMSALRSTSGGCSLARSGDIHLEDIYFSYPLRPDVEVLNGLDLTLQCGKVTALVGPSGSGKSTVVQLLARFYEPTRGRITVTGEDIRTFDKREWAQVVSVVNQEPVLFSVSIGENIAYGLPDENVSKEDVINAAKAANAHEFIISLPQGYDTLVGERGSLLSGGQRQRIAIARALLKNAPILILDEATSALDTTSERLVQEALDHLMKGRTSLVIAHRLSTVQNAHQIAVCSGGKIAELGTHIELLAKGGQYSSLVGTQRLAFE
ncbi:ABC transporter B family member 28-like [Zingiber officinale]|uniref:ABC transporter B family member 28-like n=1 Tax=Zingiber officinale TaxID=94328 RepID=UPI001C4AF794|nr:ABC transporter B family member 28-like [Zingiber officinale]